MLAAWVLELLVMSDQRADTGISRHVLPQAPVGAGKRETDTKIALESRSNRALAGYLSGQNYNPRSIALLKQFSDNSSQTCSSLSKANLVRHTLCVNAAPG